MLLSWCYLDSGLGEHNFGYRKHMSNAQSVLQLHWAFSDFLDLEFNCKETSRIPFFFPDMFRLHVQGSSILDLMVAPVSIFHKRRFCRLQKSVIQSCRSVEASICDSLCTCVVGICLFCRSCTETRDTWSGYLCIHGKIEYWINKIDYNYSTMHSCWSCLQRVLWCSFTQEQISESLRGRGIHTTITFLKY